MNIKYKDYYKYIILENLINKNIIKIPNEPGTEVIPDNHLRLYHYTDVDADQLWKDGLLLSRAKGSTYGEPNFVWASLAKPSDYKRFVEFSVPIDDSRFSMWGAKPDVSRGVDFYKDKGNDFTFQDDIKPDEFIAIHEPWHNHYRYMIEDEDMIKDVLNGKYDHLINDKFPEEAKAIKAIKANYSK